MQSTVDKAIPVSAASSLCPVVNQLQLVSSTQISGAAYTSGGTAYSCSLDLLLALAPDDVWCLSALPLPVIVPVLNRAMGLKTLNPTRVFAAAFQQSGWSARKVH